MKKVVNVYVALYPYEILQVGIKELMKRCAPSPPGSCPKHQELKDILEVELVEPVVFGGRDIHIVIDDSVSGGYPYDDVPRLVLGQDFEATDPFPELLRKIRAKLDLETL